MHEASLHDENSFVTLTYDPRFLPEDGSLDHRHFQLFMKRLRKKCGKKISFYMCGEYGERLLRPHYHVLLFGESFADDRYEWSVRGGRKYYRSDLLEASWQLGFADLSPEVTFKNAAYVARYITKKQIGGTTDAQREHYTLPDGRSVKPEYAVMSRRPGIASGWFDRYREDVFPHDFVVGEDGRKIRTPRYYMRILSEQAPTLAEEIKATRVCRRNDNLEALTDDRLDAMEACAVARSELLKRPMEAS